MPNYRRSIAEGGTFFFTVVSYQRRPVLCEEAIRRALRQAIHAVQSERPFNIDAWVLLPDHLHCVWTLPPGDSDFSTRWAMIKKNATKTTVGCVSRTVSNNARSVRSAHRGSSLSRNRRNEGLLWQRRFWEHTIRDHEDLKRCIDYVHWNPVKHGQVSNVTDWPFSTFHRYVRQGVYARDWGTNATIAGPEFGE